MPQQRYALSIRQPWAALIVLGLKTIEVRTWLTKKVGPVYIHAGKIPDDRPEAWRWIETADMTVMASQSGGIIGIAELSECITYHSSEEFATDRLQHLNEVTWFRPPRLYGFRLTEARPLPFIACTGNTFFFPVDLQIDDAVHERWQIEPPEGIA